MSHNSEKSILAERIRQALDHETEDLDAKTTMRLQSIRNEALDSLGHHQAGFGRWLRRPAFAMALTIVAVVVAVTSFWPTKRAVAPMMASDLEILVVAEPLDLYDNLDFYIWLTKKDPDAG